MKKLFLLLILVTALVGCEGPIGPQGEPGQAGSGTNWNVEYFVIKPSEWVFMGPTDNPNEIYYQCTKIPKLYDGMSEKDRYYIYDEGTIHAFLYHNYETDDETQTVLPYILNWSDVDNNLCVETYYFDYTPKDIAFYVSYSGGNANNSPDADMVYRVVMNW